MFFSKKTGFHCFVLHHDHEEQDKARPLFLVVPSELAADVMSTLKKFEKSSLNDAAMIGSLGPFSIVMDIIGFQKIDIHQDNLSWSEPILHTDFAKLIAERLQKQIDDADDQAQEELVYFIGEFTMMQDNGFVAPF